MKSDTYMFRRLSELLAEHGIEIGTQDVLPPQEADAVLYFDQVPETPADPSFLIISEPPLYSPQPWQVSNHDRFHRVFTYDKVLAEGHSRYVQYYYAIDFEGLPQMPRPSAEAFAQRKLANLVNGSIANYRYHCQPGSLLGERYKIIEWFSRHHPQEFDFYGRYIPKRLYGMSFPGMGVLKRVLPSKGLHHLAAIIQRDIKRVYRGEVKPLEKISNLNRYRFNFCFENTNNINGYVTEKLFDCFFSCTIPIYWGAPNIAEMVPADCFVDYRKFSSLAELYAFMRGFSYGDALRMFAKQQEFIKSPAAKKLSSDYFAETIFHEIKKLTSPK